MQLAVVTSQRAAALSDDDPILIAALETAGHRVHHWRWDDPAARWDQVELALIRSTWDYFERMEEFAAWLDAWRGRLRFANDIEILDWNLDKRYLLQLAAAGVPVVPTTLADEDELRPAVGEVWATGHSAIVKPVVSGGAWGLHHVRPGDALAVDAAQAPWLVQPFVASVQDRGELSLIYLGGELSHGIRKWPGAGDIRVQLEHGGRYAVEEPGREAAEIGARVLAACPGQPLYARVDLIERDGALELMEVELVEPELFFAYVPEAAGRLAAAVGVLGL